MAGLEAQVHLTSFADFLNLRKLQLPDIPNHIVELRSIIVSVLLSLETASTRLVYTHEYPSDETNALIITTAEAWLQLDYIVSLVAQVSTFPNTLFTHHFNPPLELAGPQGLHITSNTRGGGRSQYKLLLHPSEGVSFRVPCTPASDVARARSIAWAGLEALP